MVETSLKYKIFGLLSGLSPFGAYSTILGVLFICGLGVPIPEDITLIAAGFLAAGGNISFEGAMIAGFVGVLVGDTLLFTLGRLYGRRVFNWPGLRRYFTPERIHKAEVRIKENRRAICFTARFLPGLRAPVFLTVGVMRIPFWTFFLLDGFAALISVPVWVYLGFYFGNNLDEAFEKARDLQILIFAAVAILVLFVGLRMYRAHNREKKKIA